MSENYWEPHFNARASMVAYHTEIIGEGKNLLIGDSNTEAFWWNILSGYNTINAGMGGARIRDIANRANAIAQIAKPKHIHLMIGTNNVTLQENDEELSTMQEDVETIIGAFQQYGGKVVVWPVPPFTCVWNTNISRRDHINQALQTAATNTNAFWDWYWPNTFTVNGSTNNGQVSSGYATSNSLSTDGVHFSDEVQISRYYRLEVWRQHIVATTGINCV